MGRLALLCTYGLEWPWQLVCIVRPRHGCCPSRLEDGHNGLLHCYSRNHVPALHRLGLEQGIEVALGEEDDEGLALVDVG